MNSPLKVWPIFGGFLWLMLLFFRLDFTPKSMDWVIAILLLGPLVLVPMALTIIRPNCPIPVRMYWLLFIAALGLALAYALPPHLPVGVFSLPWLLLTLAGAGLAMKHVLLNWQRIDWSTLMYYSAFVFLPIGAASAVANRYGYEPLGFTPIIILLTAVHFHYAGFFLPILTGLLLKKYAFAKKNGLTGLGVLIGIPLVGLGITTSQLGISPWVETASVTVLVVATLNVAWLQAHMARKESSVLLLLSALALASGMLLALAYGWRHYFPLSFLSIPWMYAVHGTLNSVGFAATGVVGHWRSE